MRWSTDVGQVDWVRERLVDFMAVQVTSLVPRGFAAYARLLHPVHTQGRERPLRWHEVAAATGAELRANSTFERLAHPDGPPATVEQRWPGNPRIGASRARRGPPAGRGPGWPHTTRAAVLVRGV